MIRDSCPDCGMPMTAEDGLWYCAGCDAYHGETWQEDAAARRHEWIGRLLALAAADPMEQADSWARLVKLAKQYGGRAVPRPSAGEFEPYRSDYAHLPDAVWHQCPGELGIPCYRSEGEDHDGAHDSRPPEVA